MTRPTRRDLLRATGGAALGAGLVSGLGMGAAAAVRAAAGSGGVDWSALAARLTGTLVRPSDSGWAPAIELYNTRYVSIVPEAVAFCATPGDVAAAVRFARDNDLEMRARNGRHSYGGYSTCECLVIDVSAMATIEVDDAAGTARIGAGAVLIDVYDRLAAHGVTIPGGTCPSVGITGLTLGGGHGEVSRLFGMTCDALVSLEMVTADGEVVVASAEENADLFWACRGGGGGNFGIVTSLTFRTFPIDTVTLFSVDWPWSQAIDATSAWQEWVAGAPDEIFSGMALLTSPGGAGASPFLGAAGTFVGPPAALEPVLAPLAAVGTPTSVHTSEMTWGEAARVHAGCSDITEAACHPTYWNPPGTLPPGTWDATSAYVGEPLPAEGIEVIVEWVDRRQADPLQPTGSPGFGAGGVGFDSYGGAMNRPARDATAFVHRDSLALGQLLAYWTPDAAPALVEDNVAWLRGFTDALAPYTNGEAYQNYIDPGLDGWLKAYYAENLPRLREIKRRWDPDDVFRFAQSIPPAQVGPTTSSTSSTGTTASSSAAAMPRFTG